MKTSQSLTPIPSSDGPADDPEEDRMEVDKVSKSNGVRLPITPASARPAKAAPSNSAVTFSSPSRKVRSSYLVPPCCTTLTVLSFRLRRLSITSNQTTRMKMTKKSSNLSPELVGQEDAL